MKTRHVELLREIDALDGVLRAIAGVTARTDDDRRKELIDLRRQLSMLIARVGEMGDPLFADREADIYRVYRTKFSAMRSATALHQASWPAVRLGEDPARHAASVATVRQANYDFIAWTRTALAASV